MSNPSITLIQCGECGGHYVRTGETLAACESCGHTVTTTVDIAPNMDEGETLAWHADGGRELLGYTVD